MLNKKKKHIFSKMQWGQGMVEFALVIPLLLLILLGTIEFAFFFFVYSGVNSASRESVRYGAGAGTSAIGVPYYQYCQGIRDAARRIGAYSGLADTQIHIGYDSGPQTNQDWTLCLPGNLYSDWNPRPGDRVLVRISVPYEPVLSMIGFPTIQVQSQSARTIVRALEIEATPLTSPTEDGGGGSLATETQISGGGESETPTQNVSSTPTRTPTRTPTAVPTCKFSDPRKCETPEVCMTPLELGGCE